MSDPTIYEKAYWYPTDGLKAAKDWPGSRPAPSAPVKTRRRFCTTNGERTVVHVDDDGVAYFCTWPPGHGGPHGRGSRLVPCEYAGCSARFIRGSTNCLVDMHCEKHAQGESHVRYCKNRAETN